MMRAPGTGVVPPAASTRARSAASGGPIRLRKFDPSKMRDSLIVVFVAPKNSGKSTLLADFMYHKRHLPAGFCFSATEESNEFFSKMIPPAYCYTHFDTRKLTKIYEHQKAKVNAYKRRGGDRNPVIFGVIEDCMADKKVFKETIVRDLFMNGRHRKMFVLITVQYIVDLPPDLRTNVDMYVVLRQSNVDARRKLYTCVAGACGTWKQFNEIMDVATNDHRCLVIDNGVSSNRIEDRVFWYKAKIREPFRVGCARFWRYNKRNYKSREARGGEAVGSAERAARARLGRRGYGSFATDLDARSLFAQLPRAGAVGGAAGAAAAGALSAVAPVGASVLLAGDEEEEDGGGTQATSATRPAQTTLEAVPRSARPHSAQRLVGASPSRREVRTRHGRSSGRGGLERTRRR